MSLLGAEQEGRASTAPASSTFAQKHLQWDVLLLGSTAAHKSEPTNSPAQQTYSSQLTRVALYPEA